MGWVGWIEGEGRAEDDADPVQIEALHSVEGAHFADGFRNFRPGDGSEIVLVPWEGEPSFPDVVPASVQAGGVIDGGGDPGEAVFPVSGGDGFVHGLTVIKHLEVIAGEVLRHREEAPCDERVDPLQEGRRRFHAELAGQTASAAGPPRGEGADHIFIPPALGFDHLRRIVDEHHEMGKTQNVGELVRPFVAVVGIALGEKEVRLVDDNGIIGLPLFPAPVDEGRRPAEVFFQKRWQAAGKFPVDFEELRVIYEEDGFLVPVFLPEEVVEMGEHHRFSRACFPGDDVEAGLSTGGAVVVKLENILQEPVLLRREGNVPGVKAVGSEIHRMSFLPGGGWPWGLLISCIVPQTGRNMAAFSDRRFFFLFSKKLWKNQKFY